MPSGVLAMPLQTRTPAPQPLAQTAGVPAPAVSPQLVSLLSDIFNRYSGAWWMVRGFTSWGFNASQIGQPMARGAAVRAQRL
eukprot:359869-Chlamydomonas_euryale.AAC.33